MQYKQKRHWGRVVVVLLVLAGLIAAAIWLLAPKIRKLSLSSQRHVLETPVRVAAVPGQSRLPVFLRFP